MTFPIPQGRSDPRVLCGMLAEQALTELAPAQLKRAPDTVAAVCLMNLMRVLERYRHGVMHAVAQPVGILEGVEDEPLNWLAAEEDPMVSLDGLLLAAQQSAYPGSNKEEVVTKVRSVLRRRLTGRKINATEAGDATKFLQALIDQIELQPAQA